MLRGHEIHSSNRIIYAYFHKKLKLFHNFQQYTDCYEELILSAAVTIVAISCLVYLSFVEKHVFFKKEKKVANMIHSWSKLQRDLIHCFPNILVNRIGQRKTNDYSEKVYLSIYMKHRYDKHTEGAGQLYKRDGGRRGSLINLDSRKETSFSPIYKLLNKKN